jgi:hypothetical protein
MKTTRVAKTRAMEKIRTCAARLNDDHHQEGSNFGRLPLHLQLHIQELAKEAFAREHMQGKVHAELLFAVSKRKMKATDSCLHNIQAVKERLNTLTELQVEDLDVLLNDVLTAARLRLLDELIALFKLLVESISELWEVHSQLTGVLWCIDKNPGICPFLLGADICFRTEALRYQLLQVEERAKAACFVTSCAGLNLPINNAV